MELLPRIPTYGEIFPKFMIELVAGDESLGHPNLLLWDGAKTHIQPSVPLTPGPNSEFEARIYEAPKVDSTIWRAIRFPARPSSYESTCKLFDDLCLLVQKFTALPEQLIPPVVHTVLASWFPDCTSIPVSLSIIGPQSSQGSQLFRLLSCLYRRPLLLTEMNASGLSSLPMELCPSLFLERYEFSAPLQKLLRAFNAPGAYLPRKGRLISASFPRVICTAEPLNDDAIGTSAIKIPVVPQSLTHAPLLILDRATQQQIADEYQGKLLTYRLVNYKRVAQSNFDAASFLLPMRELARCLGACVPDEPELQHRIAAWLGERNEEIREEVTTNLNFSVVEALFAFAHDRERESVYVGQVTAAVNALLEQRGELLELKPRSIGYRLRALGLTSKRLDHSGRGVTLVGSTRARIHRLAREYRLPLVKGCSYCDLLLDEERDSVLHGPEL